MQNLKVYIKEQVPGVFVKLSILNLNIGQTQVKRKRNAKE